MTKVKNIPIPLPPLSEQKRIVAVLDKAFAAIDKARENIAKNLQNTTELFQSTLSQIFTQKGEGWEERKLGEVCEFARGLTYSKRDEIDISKNIVLRANNIDLNTKAINLDELKYIKDSIHIPPNKKIKKGCIIICTASGSKNHLGKVALIHKDYDFAFGGFMGQIETKPEIISKFLYYCMISERYEKFISNLSDGVNINNLKWSQLYTYSISLPPLSEQKTIVATLDKIRENIQNLEYTYQEKMNNLAEMKKTILERAFRGALM